jgi:hypothetical protein
MVHGELLSAFQCHGSHDDGALVLVSTQEHGVISEPFGYFVTHIFPSLFLGRRNGRCWLACNFSHYPIFVSFSLTCSVYISLPCTIEAVYHLVLEGFPGGSDKNRRRGWQILISTHKQAHIYTQRFRGSITRACENIPKCPTIFRMGHMLKRACFV